MRGRKEAKNEEEKKKGQRTQKTGAEVTHRCFIIAFFLFSQRINASKNLHKLTKSTGVGRTLRNPSDVPGTLLNMALLNLGTDNDSLRLAAYNMLDALCKNFHFVVQLQLLGTEGLGQKKERKEERGEGRRKRREEIEGGERRRYRRAKEPSDE